MYNQNHGCRCPGDARSQGISSHGIGLILPDYSGLSPRRIKPPPHAYLILVKQIIQNSVEIISATMTFLCVHRVEVLRALEHMLFVAGTLAGLHKALDPLFLCFSAVVDVILATVSSCGVKRHDGVMIWMRLPYYWPLWGESYWWFYSQRSGNAEHWYVSLLNKLRWNLYKATTKLCGLSRQVVSHDRENKHAFLKTVLDKCWHLCVFNKTSPVSLYRLHCIINSCDAEYWIWFMCTVTNHGLLPI